ncbi:MAG TPA: hypothetical protein ENK19_10935 [Acidobacteria bacterium]|nr:hypothetical protein [Acidobacteriota bacterium]
MELEGNRIEEIGPEHPLRQLFSRLVSRAMARGARLRDPRIVSYLAELLTRFSDTRNLYAIRDATGRPLEDVGEMLLEADPMGPGGGFGREREVRRHIGDFTLFFLGLFPEHLEAHATTRIPGLYVDWAATGRESYRIAAAFDVGPWAEEAEVFARLAERYDACVRGLRVVRHEMDRMSDPVVQMMGRLLGSG